MWYTFNNAIYILTLDENGKKYWLIRSIELLKTIKVYYNTSKHQFFIV